MRKNRLIDLSTALGVIAFLGALLLAPAAEAEPQAARSRSSASSASSGSSVSRSSAPSSGAASSRSSPGAAVTRTSGRSPSSGPRTPVSGVSTHRSSAHGHSHGGYAGRYHHGPYPYYGYYPYYGGYYPYYPYGWSFGLGWWGGYLHLPYSSYYRPYYYSPYPVPYGRYPEAARVAAEPVGAFDLNVKPKKTEVWVDGHYVGTAGRFDGFPDYLWLGEGKHQLVFFLDGHATVERQVETQVGAVVDLRIGMERGRSIPPRQLAVQPPPPPRRPSAAPLAEAEAEAEADEEAGAPADSRDLRAAPGRLVLSVEPDDASVYLDGRYLGTGRDLASLHAGLLIDSGAHRLEVVRPGYAERAIEFTVAAGEEERIEIGLEGG